MLTIVMYHYVRDPERTPFPAIKARTTAEFAHQLDFVARTYQVVGCAEVAEAYGGGRRLPENACLLTFDDGLLDHVETVAPALRARGLRACFCVPAWPVLEPVVLDVHKVQFVLAASRDHAHLVARILDRARQGRDEVALPPDGELRERYSQHRFDPPPTALAKRLLQDVLPEPVRTPVLDELFADLVTPDEAAFSRGLYLSLEAVRGLAAEGMDVAGHGFAHRRLGLLTESEQREEIERTCEFLACVQRAAPSRWTMCYPYGSRDGTTLRLLEGAGCAIGLTTDVGVAGPSAPALELPRLDTNDLVPDRQAAAGLGTASAR